MTHPDRRTGWPLQHRCASVDRELRFPVEDDEHLFALIVEMRADAALRLDDSPMQEIQVRIERGRVEESHVIQLPRTTVHAGRRAIFGRLGVGDALRQRQLLRVGLSSLLGQQNTCGHRHDRRDTECDSFHQSPLR